MHDVITTEKELKQLIKEKILPAYEAAYADEKTDFEELNMMIGICFYAKKSIGVCIYREMDGILEEQGYNVGLIAEEWVHRKNKEISILPRIEWMRKYIKE